MERKHFKIKNETRESCKIYILDEETINTQYAPINMSIYHLLYETNSINFTIYFRVGQEMVTYITPDNFSKIRLDDIKKGASIDNYTTDTYILRSEEKKYFALLDRIRKEKIDRLGVLDPSLDKNMLAIICNMSALSQRVVKGSLSASTTEDIAIAISNVVEQHLHDKKLLVNLLRLIKADPGLYEHSATVGVLGGIIAKQLLNLSTPDVTKTVLAGIYHDIGMTDFWAMTTKSGKFHEEELSVIKTHTTIGFEELSKVIMNGGKIDLDIAKVALEHHERFSGQGYPHGRKGRFENNREQGMTIFSRIIAIADVFSALMIERSYKPAYNMTDSIKILSIHANEEHDPEIIHPFLNLISKNREEIESENNIKNPVFNSQEHSIQYSETKKTG